MAKLLVIKSAKDYSTDKGYAIPIALEEDDGSFRNIGANEFPNNNRIFISKEYEKIDEQFKDQELFFLEKWSESEKDWKENKNIEKYYSRGIWAARAETNTYLPIIKMSMPDISTGQVENGFGIPASNSPFFILNNNIVSGPFLAKKEDEYWLLTPTTGINPLNIDNNHIAQFELSDLKKAGIIIDNEALGSNKLILTSLRKAAEIKFNKKDYISNSGIIKFFGKQGFGKRIPSITKREATKLYQIINEHCKQKKVFNNNERFNRLEDILDEFINAQDSGGDIIDNFLAKTKEGKEYLDKYATDHRNSILNDKNEDLNRQIQAYKEHYERELAETKAKVEAKKSELDQISRRVEEERNNYENKIQEIKKKTKEEREKILNDEFKNLSNKISDLKKDKDYIEIYLREKNKELAEIERQVEIQKALISSPDIVETLTKHKTLNHILNGISSDSNESNIRPLALSKSSIVLAKESRKTLSKAYALTLIKNQTALSLTMKWQTL